MKKLNNPYHPIIVGVHFLRRPGYFAGPSLTLQLGLRQNEFAEWNLSIRAICREQQLLRPRKRYTSVTQSTKVIKAILECFCKALAEYILKILLQRSVLYLLHCSGSGAGFAGCAFARPMLGPLVSKM